MMGWFDDFGKLKSVFSQLAEHDARMAIELGRHQTWDGYCTACRQPTQFTITHGQEQPGEWRNLLEGMQCACGTNGRTRLALSAWRSVRERFQPRDTLIFERVTPLFGLMQNEDPTIVGCEFLGPDRLGGESYEGGGVMIRHEDMTAMSCADASLDLIMHFDVTEHVPDHRAAFRECHRSLRPGGIMLFTVPFFDQLDRHLVRAQLVDGEVRHLLDPAYHGNPMGGGALVFFHPGWQLFDDLADAGFETTVALEYNPYIGIVSNGCPYPDGHMWPVVFMARRPASA